MHMPDGVLSPATSAVAGIVMLPIWAVAGRQVRRSVGSRQIPMLALGAAFCFTIMMFNIPALGGTTAHPVAGTLLAILLGPWAAVIGISTALAIQALFFGDGGVLAYGANCFTMAFVLPFVGYSVYRLLAGKADAGSGRRVLAAAVGSYVGLNAAASVVAVLLGLQPVLFHEANGHALYFPFGMKITLPAMLGTHLIVAGPAEAITTALVVRYLQSAGYALYGVSADPDRAEARRKRREALWIGLLALMALSPLGLIASGDAFGEWDAQGVQEQIKKVQGTGYVPRGFAQAERRGYKGLPGLRDYAQPETGRNNLGYVGAALLGVGSIVALLLIAGRLLKARDDRPPDPPGGHIHRDEQDVAAGGPVGPGVQAANVELPEWLRRPSGADAARDDMPPPSSRYVERTLAALAAGTATALRDEAWARQDGYLQRIDARAKLLGLLALIVVSACLRQIVPLLLISLLALILAAASRLPLGRFTRRVWLSTPLFVGAIALPQMLNLVTPGRALLVLWTHPYLAVTAPGLTGAIMLALRVGAAVSLGALLTLTTRWHDLLRALRALLVPRLFITILMMAYRYVALLLLTAGEMFVARRSRTVGPATNADGRRFVGAGIGALFGKTLSLSEEVHAAMVSRGYNGEMRMLTPVRWRANDTVWALAVALVALLALHR